MTNTIFSYHFQVIVIKLQFDTTFQFVHMVHIKKYGKTKTNKVHRQKIHSAIKGKIMMTTLSVRDESFVCIALACLTPLWRLMPLPFPALNSLVFNTEQKRHFALGVCVHVREFLYIASKLRTGQTPF